MKLFLIGYRGSGKTSVARLLAAQRDSAWLDSDEEIERSAGKTIAAIFEDDGEAAFRELESQVISELAEREANLVVALGGGAPMRPENRQLLAQAGKVVWLRASPETLWQRISADRTTQARRPALTSYGGLDEIRTLLAERDLIYRACADLEIDTEGKTPVQVSQEIIDSLRKA